MREWVRWPFCNLTTRDVTGTSAKREQRNEETNWAEWGCRWTRSASGTVTQGKQCSGSHLVETGERGWGGGGVGRRGWEGQWVEERVATSTSIWKSRFFLSLQQSGKANVSALRPRLTVLHSAPPPGPPCSATEYGQQ